MQCNQSLGKCHLVYLPILDGESSFDVTCEGLARLGISGVLEIVVTDWKFGIRLLHIRVVNDTDIAAPEDRSFVWVAGYGELCQVEAELFPEIN